MPRVSDVPRFLRPYRFHGVEVEARDGSDQAVGDCPFCGREGKFSVTLATGQWRCYVCNEGAESDKVNRGGNLYTFLRLLWSRSFEATTTADYEALASERGLLDENTPMLWGAARSVVTGEWLLPGYAPDGKLMQLYRYAADPASGRSLLLATSEVSHQMFRPIGASARASTVYVAEGPWDGMAWWESLRQTCDEGGELSLTASESSSLLADAEVLAAPGCNAFPDNWTAHFGGRRVVFLYDSDHPRLRCETCKRSHSKVNHLLCPRCRGPLTGPETPPAGYAGAKRVATVLASAETPPARLEFLSWGEEGFARARPDGFDVRDLLRTGGGEARGRLAPLAEALAALRPIPEDWVPGRTGKARSTGGVEIGCEPCSSWEVLVNAWKRSGMKWIEGLDRALSVMLASVLSTPAAGDQLWVKIIGPPSCGKSVLCEALSVNKKWVLAKSTIRGFHSGFQSDREGKEDNSLAAVVRDKTLVTKDGDTLLQSPNLGQILAEARDIYDRTSRTHYRNKMSRDYENLPMTWLLCGTESLRSLDDSELGERFLDSVIVDRMDDDTEDDIAVRVGHRALQSLALVSNGKAVMAETEEMLRAKRLTGGYVDHLRKNAHDLLAAVDMPDGMIRRCARLAKFVAFMRARPSSRQEEKSQRELCFRLTSQHVRLAGCLAAVLNRSSVDEEVMRRVRAVSLDTARGRVLAIASLLRDAGRRGEEGMYLSRLALLTNESEDKERLLLRFLRKIGVVEPFQTTTSGVTSRVKWRLQTRFVPLYDEVVGEGL